jgi:hypothetical protein
MGVYVLTFIYCIVKKNLVQTDKTSELYHKLRRDKARDREVKNTTARRPFWKRDWRK